VAKTVQIKKYNTIDTGLNATIIVKCNEEQLPRNTYNKLLSSSPTPLTAEQQVYRALIT
jgi:hypothetical protein